jgi:hypothetical protein
MSLTKIHLFLLFLIKNMLAMHYLVGECHLIKFFKIFSQAEKQRDRTCNVFIMILQFKNKAHAKLTLQHENRKVVHL